METPTFEAMEKLPEELQPGDIVIRGESPSFDGFVYFGKQLLGGIKKYFLHNK